MLAECHRWAIFCCRGALNGVVKLPSGITEVELTDALGIGKHSPAASVLPHKEERGNNMSQGHSPRAMQQVGVV
jgi:hypothetical protein